MFQGKGATDERNQILGPVDPARLDALSSRIGHLDHTGRLPLLAARDFTARCSSRRPPPSFRESYCWIPRGFKNPIPSGAIANIRNCRLSYRFTPRLTSIISIH